jgi:hypothetical protein
MPNVCPSFQLRDIFKKIPVIKNKIVKMLNANRPHVNTNVMLMAMPSKTTKLAQPKLIEKIEGFTNASLIYKITF